MWKKQIIFFLFFFLLFAPPLTQAKSITATGMGSSSEEAINDALRSAVEQVVGTLVSSETLTENLQLVRDQVLSTSRGYVNGFEILEQKRQPNGLFTATVKAEVDTNPDSALLSQLQKLNLIKHGLQDPRIAVIISDRAGESAIIKKMLEAGFTRLVDQNRIAAIRNNDIVKSLMNGDVATAKSIATQFGADYIMVGEAFSKRVDAPGGYNLGGLISCRASVEARLIRADTGQIVATNVIPASGVDVEEHLAAQKALGNAGGKMGDYMVEQLMKFGGNMEKNIKLTVTGITNFKKVSEAENSLRGLKGVKNVYTRDYSSGVAVFELDATVPVKTLADSIGSISGEVRLEVTGITGSAITAVMRY